MESFDIGVVSGMEKVAKKKRRIPTWAGVAGTIGAGGALAGGLGLLLRRGKGGGQAVSVAARRAANVAQKAKASQAYAAQAAARSAAEQRAARGATEAFKQRITGSARGAGNRVRAGGVVGRGSYARRGAARHT